MNKNNINTESEALKESSENINASLSLMQNSFEKKEGKNLSENLNSSSSEFNFYENTENISEDLSQKSKENKLNYLNEEESPLSVDAPKFEMKAPEPEIANTVFDLPENKKPSINQNTMNISYNKNIVNNTSIVSEEIFPEEIKTSLDKVEFLIDKTVKKIENRDYKDINSFYRKAYEIYMNSDDLSPNERYLAGEKLEDLFLRIKNIYVVSHVVS